MGAPAVAGRVSVVPKGDFLLGTAYKRLDLVKDLGRLYIAKADNTNIPTSDTTKWMLAADSGTHYEEVQSIPTAQTAEEGVVYLLKNNSSTGSNKYSQYILLDGVVVCINEYGTDLSDYITYDSSTETITFKIF